MTTIGSEKDEPYSFYKPLIWGSLSAHPSDSTECGYDGSICEAKEATTKLSTLIYTEVAAVILMCDKISEYIGDFLT